MDARVGDRVVTPRIGKPVEVQALWLNALWAAAQWAPRFAEPMARGRAAFAARFWNAARGCLFDVVDVDHRPGTADATVRPNQILAVGGLPLALLDGERARSVVDVVERSLCTPLGLRSLAPDEPGYAGRYEGDGRSRDSRYHQGTAWPWLIGPFVDAWVRVRGDDAATRREAANASSPRSSPTSTRPASATSPRSPTAMPRTPRAGAPSKPGRSASCCASIACCDFTTESHGGSQRNCRPPWPPWASVVKRHSARDISSLADHGDE
jgi:glycogen debranching enzyme